MDNKITPNRKSFARAAAQLSHDDYNEVVVYDEKTGTFSVSNRTTAGETGETIVMHGDTGYCTDGMTVEYWIDYFMSGAFDFSDIVERIEQKS